MKDIVGVFRRAGPKDEWKRLMAQGTIKQAWAFQQIYPDHEIAMFKYDGFSSILSWSPDKLKLVK